jgi:hypothetical protein
MKRLNPLNDFLLRKAEASFARRMDWSASTKIKETRRAIAIRC